MKIVQVAFQVIPEALEKEEQDGRTPGCQQMYLSEVALEFPVAVAQSDTSKNVDASGPNNLRQNFTYCKTRRTPV